MKTRWLVPLLTLLALLLLPGEALRPFHVGAQEAAVATVSGRVEVQGAARHDGVTVRLGLDTLVTQADGAFTFSGVQPGFYTLSAEVPGYLAASVTGLAVTKGAAVDAGLLVVSAGDVNDDGVVDAADFDAIAAGLGASPSLNPVLDYNRDGRVDILDLVLATGNRGKTDLGAPAVDSTSVSGVVIDQADGDPLQDVAVTVQVDLNADGLFAPVGQNVLLLGMERSFRETQQQQTDVQGAFTFEDIPLLKDGNALGVLLELQKEGYGTFTQSLSLGRNTVLSIPMSRSVQLGDDDISDGIQLVLTGSPAEVEIDVPAEAVPPGVTSVTGLLNYNNPRNARDLFPGNYRAADAALGEVQLESTVYAQIDLRDQDGNAILATNGGNSGLASIRLKVPEDQYPTLRDMTPDNPDEVNVPLYSFDYEAGIWRPSNTPGRLETEDGAPVNQDQLLSIWKGEFSGTLYVAGRVSHFSQWNVDYPVNSHSAVCGQIVDITGAPIRDAQIRSYGTTYLSNWTKTQQTDGSGTFCDDFKVSEEEDAEEEEERSPPAVRILEAGMSGSDQFTVRVEVRYQGDDTVRRLKVRAELTNQGEDAPFATLEDEVSAGKGPVTIDFPFCLVCKRVPRFREHVDVHVDAEARETWSDPTETLTATDTREGRILLPVVITHGITGDFAATAIGGYNSVGPGLDEMAAALATDGYEEGGPYPTAHVLVYPSLHARGIQWIAANSLQPLVERIVGVGLTYADRVDIVAHSMGGLVSRYYIESSPGLNQGDNVRKLVMVGTPNEGAAGAHVSLEGEGLFTPSASTLLSLGSFSGATGATGETNIGLTTSQQLLPAYPYYREITSLRLTGYGWPTDSAMDLGLGSSGLLGFNAFIDDLNEDGLDSRVDNFIIYRNNQNTTTTLTRREGLITWSTTEEVGPGDATVPERSAILSDYPAARAQLKKCLINGGIHAEMMLDPQIRTMVRAILILDEGEEPPGCNPAGGPLPEDPRDIVDTLREFILEQKAHSHPPRQLSFTKISGLAGELRGLEDRSPWMLRNMGPLLQKYVRGLSDSEVDALAGALQRWGLDTQVLARHAPGLGRAARSAAAVDAAARRDALEQGVVASFLHNVTQGLIQMMLYAAAESHSSEEAGRFASHTADLKVLQRLLEQMAATRIAVQTWQPIGPTITALGALGPGADADVKVAKLEELLVALAGEEQYSGWVFRSGAGNLENVRAPAQDLGGGERARILVFWNSKIFQPRVSDIGVDWQDMGVPRLRTSSTAWVGTPSMSAGNPARWIGAVMLEEVGLRRITGRVVTTAGSPVADLTVRGAVSVRTTYGEQVDSKTATTAKDGSFTLLVPRGLDIRLALSHPAAQPIQALPEVPTGTEDLNLGDIKVGARPVISSTTISPERPERGAPLTLSVEASHPLGQPLTYTWEQVTTRWAREPVGEGARVRLAAAEGPATRSFRVVVSDGVFKTDRRLSVTPVNLPPEVLSLQAASAEVFAGQSLSFTATARDGDGDPLTYQWGCSPGCWWPWPYPTKATATWLAPWSPEDRTYSIQARVTDGALHDLDSVEVTVLGRPDPTVSLAVTPVDGRVPLAVTLSATAEDPVGRIVKYTWLVQKLSPWRYYSNRGYTATDGNTLAETLGEPGAYRVQVSATNDIGRSVSSDWVDVLVLAAPTVRLAVDVSKGPLPLTVGFTATAADADGEIAKYQWDFEGDGTVDETTTANTATHTYERAGTFQSQVTAVDDDGITGSATIGITATGRPLSASLSANPQEGFAPLEVTFTAAADPGPVKEYRWDFEGDGTVDETTTSNTATHTYESIGGFPAQVKAIAEDGGTATAWLLVFVLNALPPSVTLTADPASGGAPLGVTFTAAATDLDGQVAEYRWDFDGDATVDQTTTVNTASHTYNKSGVFTAAVTAVDDDGLTGTGTVTINITACRTAAPPAGQTLPHVFVGTASIGGTPAPDGTRVVALVGCDVAGAAVTSGGGYTLQVAPAQGESYAGKTITFTVGGFATGQTATWELGGGTILNLTASAPSGG